MADVTEKATQETFVNEMKTWFWRLPVIPRLTVVALLANAWGGFLLEVAACVTAQEARPQACLLVLRSLALAVALGLHFVTSAPSEMLPWALLFAAVRLGDVAVGIHGRQALRFIPSLPLAVMLFACLIPLVGDRLGRRPPEAPEPGEGGER
jgi:hypothetical protein